MHSPEIDCLIIAVGVKNSIRVTYTSMNQEVHNDMYYIKYTFGPDLVETSGLGWIFFLGFR